jgi:hypothetical protein
MNLLIERGEREREGERGERERESGRGREEEKERARVRQRMSNDTTFHITNDTTGHITSEPSYTKVPIFAISLSRALSASLMSGAYV